MAFLYPDFSQVVNATPRDPNQKITPGDYMVRIISYDFDTKDYPPELGKFLNLKFKIFGMSGEFGQFNNWPVFYRCYYTGNKAWMLKKLVEAAAHIPQHEQTEEHWDADFLVGKELIVSVVEGKDKQGLPTKWPRVINVKQLNAESIPF